MWLTLEKENMVEVKISGKWHFIIMEPVIVYPGCQKAFIALKSP